MGCDQLDRGCTDIVCIVLTSVFPHQHVNIDAGSCSLHVKVRCRAKPHSLPSENTRCNSSNIISPISASRRLSVSNMRHATAHADPGNASLAPLDMRPKRTLCLMQASILMPGSTRKGRASCSAVTRDERRSIVASRMPDRLVSHPRIRHKQK